MMKKFVSKVVIMLLDKIIFNVYIFKLKHISQNNISTKTR